MEKDYFEFSSYLLGSYFEQQHSEPYSELPHFAQKHSDSYFGIPSSEPSSAQPYSEQRSELDFGRRRSEPNSGRDSERRRSAQNSGLGSVRFEHSGRPRSFEPGSGHSVRFALSSGRFVLPRNLVYYLVKNKNPNK